MKTFCAKNFPAISAVLRAGKVAILPTETIPGFSVDPGKFAALKNLQKLKRRAAKKPFVILVENFEAAEKLVEFSPLAKFFAQNFWTKKSPATTLVLPRFENSLPGFFPHEKFLAVRVPAAKTLRDFLKNFGAPIVSTSVNFAGEKPLLDWEKIAAKFGGAEVFPPEKNWKPSQNPSTILKIENENWKILRDENLLKNKIEKLATDFFSGTKN